MTIIELLFYIILFSQVMYLSYIIPNNRLKRIQNIFNQYPPDSYPKLYPESIEKYKRDANLFQWANRAIMVFGFGLIIWFYGSTRTGEWDRVIVFWYFMLQFLPFWLMEIWTKKWHKHMRLVDSDVKKAASLHPRKFTDFISKETLGVALGVYVIFVAFIIFMDQFNYPWFGGYINILVMTGGYLFFALILYKAIYGKVKDPHQSHENRMDNIKLLAKQIVGIGIAMTLYAIMQISLKAVGINQIEPITVSIYFHIIGFICSKAVALDTINFEVYKVK